MGLDRGDAALALSCLAAGLALLLWAHLRTPLLPGIDGPYYAAQVEWIDSRGGLRHPDPPLAFYLLWVFYRAVGDPILGVKLGASLLTAAASVPAYLMVREETGGRIPALAAGLSLPLSWYVVRLATDFIKNSVGLLWVTLWLWAAGRQLRTGGWSWAAALASALAALTHSLDFAYVLASSLLLLPASAATGRVRRAAPLAAAAVAAAAVLIAFPQIVGGDVTKGVKVAEMTMEGESAGAFDPVQLGAGLALVGAALGGWLSPGGSALAAAAGAVAVILGLPVYPRQYLMRFRLMAGIPLSLAAGLAPGRSPDSRALAAGVLVPVVLAGGLLAARAARPTITPEQYSELAAALEAAPAGTPIVVRSAPLRYWAEVLSEDVVPSPPAGVSVAELEGDVDRRGPPRPSPWRPPPGSVLLFDGRWFDLYLIPAARAGGPVGLVRPPPAPSGIPPRPRGWGL